jgi:AcrR family transcriptional regulator
VFEWDGSGCALGGRGIQTYHSLHARMGGRWAMTRGEDPAADLTARARIRDAALLQFAERGVGGATIRGIAESAGVSPGLVQHHFGTKEGLRQVCDEYAIGVLRERKEEVLKGGANDPDFVSVTVHASVPVQRYLARALADGSPQARELFDDTVAYAEELLARDITGVLKIPTADPHGLAAAMTAMQLGVIVLHEHLSRVLGADVLSERGYPRLALALLDVYGGLLLTPEFTAELRAAFTGAMPTPGEGTT